MNPTDPTDRLPFPAHQTEPAPESMAISNDKFKNIREGLLILYRSASGIDSWKGDQAQRLIDAGEYSLALDEISYA